MLKIHTTALER